MLDAGDGIALAAVVVSVGAAVISAQQAKTAKQSAESAKEQAAHAEEANDLTRQQMAREEARERQTAIEADAAALREARKVKFCFKHVDETLIIELHNKGSRPIHDVTLVDVRALDPGHSESWSVDRAIGDVPHASTRSERIAPDRHMTVWVWFLDAAGNQVPLPPDVDTEARFCDADDQWWHTTLKNGTYRIDEPAS